MVCSGTPSEHPGCGKILWETLKKAGFCRNIWYFSGKNNLNQRFP